MKTCWEILGIEITKDKRTIKKAYSELVKKYHPEEYPSEYKEVRQAYEQAILYTKIKRVLPIVQFEEKGIKEKNTLHNPNIEDEEYRLFLNIQIEIDQKIQDIIDGTVIRYNGFDANNIGVWKQWFEENMDNNQLIIETLLDTGLSKINNEIVIQYLLDIIKEIPYDNKSVYKQRMNTLRKASLLIEEQEIALYKRLLGYFLIVFHIFSFLIILLIILLYLYLSVFSDSKETLQNIGLFVVSVFIAYQATKSVNRVVSKSETFFYRDVYLIFVALISALCNGIFIMLTYTYIQDGILSFSKILMTITLSISVLIAMHTKRYQKEQQNKNQKRKKKYH